MPQDLKCQIELKLFGTSEDLGLVVYCVHTIHSVFLEDYLVQVQIHRFADNFNGGCRIEMGSEWDAVTLFVFIKFEGGVIIYATAEGPGASVCFGGSYVVIKSIFGEFHRSTLVCIVIGNDNVGITFLDDGFQFPCADKAFVAQLSAFVG